jgi:hypothetical protein
MGLLWCARPELRHDISGSRTSLNNAAHFISSTQCGTAGPPNNVYGWGRVDIVAATGSAPPPCPPCFWPMGWTEDFDDVTPPALPADWIATNAQGPPPLWVTSNSGVPMPPADTPPNAAFIDDPAVVSDKWIDSWQFTIFEAISPWLVFRHNFNLEASDVDPNAGFDGGVLEISVDQGQTYHDILDAGGSFLIGGYNRTISSDRGSPIAGRRAWSGNSQGFITTVVALPSQVIEGRLRWRMGSDTSGSNEGWRVDTVNVSWCQGPPCTPTATPPATPTASPPLSPTPTATATITVSPSPTATATGTARATPSPTSTATPTPTARPNVTPRSRPTPVRRPTP